MDRMLTTPPRLLYCRCAHAQMVPLEVKDAVLKQLCASDRPLHAVADLCELAARRDPALKRWAEQGPLKIAACYPRAVQWLFAASGVALPKDGTEVLNMRAQTADEIVAGLLRQEVRPNLPGDPTLSGKVVASNQETRGSSNASAAPEHVLS
jgi:hypothetical protein